MPFYRIKNFFILSIIWLVGACSKDLSKSGKLKFIGKGCLYVVLSLISGNESVRLGNMCR